MTFNQQYRQYKRMNTEICPTLDQKVVREFGVKRAIQFKRFSAIENQISPFTVNVRINYRSEASKRSDWPSNSSRLNKMWYSFK
jgi:hypothetical protein